VPDFSQELQCFQTITCFQVSDEMNHSF
jgi:hypothetical protein